MCDRVISSNEVQVVGSSTQSRCLQVQNVKTVVEAEVVIRIRASGR